MHLQFLLSFVEERAVEDLLKKEENCLFIIYIVYQCRICASMLDGGCHLVDQLSRKRLILFVSLIWFGVPDARGYTAGFLLIKTGIMRRTV